MNDEKAINLPRNKELSETERLLIQGFIATKKTTLFHNQVIATALVLSMLLILIVSNDVWLELVVYMLVPIFGSIIGVLIVRFLFGFRRTNPLKLEDFLWSACPATIIGCIGYTIDHDLFFAFIGVAFFTAFFCLNLAIIFIYRTKHQIAELTSLLNSLGGADQESCWEAKSK